MHKKPLLLLVFWIMVVFAGCKKDDETVNNNTPAIELTSSVIHSEQGREIVIKGTLTDAGGLQSVTLYNKNWYLDKTITLNQDSTIKNYNLSYKFLVPVTSGEETVVVTVKNTGGKTASSNLIIKMDGDFNIPTITIKGTLTDGTTLVPGEGDIFDLDFLFSDDRKLGSVNITESTLGLNENITEFTSTSYEYKNQSIPVPLKTADYSFKVACTDSAGNTKNLAINVKVKLTWDFDAMYLADVTTVDELNSDLFGVPMLCNKKSSYNYEIIYFCEKANTPIRFLPQKTGFKPNCFTADPNNAGKLINSSAAAGIIIPSVGYYKININTNPDNLGYTVASFDPMSDPNRPAPYTVMLKDTSGAYHGPLGLVGSGFTNCPNMNWSPSQVKNYNELQLKQDADYPYRWSTTVTVSGDVQFIIQPEHPWNWWPEPFWRFNNKTNPETTVLKGGSNCQFNVPTATTYKFTWDQYTNRPKMVKVQ